MKLNWNFQRVGGGGEGSVGSWKKSLLWGRYGHFSGIIQYKKVICYIVSGTLIYIVMKGQRIGKVCLLKQGCVVLRFFSVWFTVTGAMKIFCYTEDFFIYRVHAEVC